MSNRPITYVSKSGIPFEEAFLMGDRFVLLNMNTEGIWYVDKEHPEWEKIRETALAVAKTFGDKKQIELLTNNP